MVSLKAAMTGDGFVLTDRDGASVSLSGEEVFSLSQSLQILIAQIQAERSHGTIVPKPTIDVIQAVTNTDLHNSRLYLGLVTMGHVEIGFVLPPDVAKPLSEHMQLRVRELELAAAKRTEH